MALQSEVSPPIVGDPNKVTQIDGDTKSEDDSASSTEDEVDLEDGEILDSGAEEEKEKDFSNVSLQEALDQSCLQNIEQLVNQAKNAKAVIPEESKLPSPRKMNKMSAKYMDHDRNEDSSSGEDGWFPPSPKYKHKSKFEEKPVDYRMELAAYRGTPPSSPDRKKDDKARKKRSSKKSKKSRKTIKRRDIKGQRVARYKKDAIKGKICRFYKEGKCAKGSDCMYSHASPFKKKEICKFYLNGHCNKGKDCLYMHNDFPCKFYHTGSECYAKDNCRFSHDPLTDEMKRVLADYLRMSHGDDYRHRLEDRDREEHNRDRGCDRDKKRRRSRSPEPRAPPPKRTCLLGSPPRHIREAEETKRWQEEMKMLEKESHPSFEIRLSPNPQEMSPTFQKPNFYQETLLNTPSPKRKPPNKDGSASYHSTEQNDYEDPDDNKVYIYDDDNELIEIDVSSVKKEPIEEKPTYHWEKLHPIATPENDVKPFNENLQQEPDFTNDVKFDETTQFSEMESSTDCPPNLSPDPSVLPAPKPEDLPSYQSPVHIKTEEEESQAVEQPPAKPMVIPSHLPRRQQELFMRVLQHQRKNKESPGHENSDSDAKKDDCEEEIEESPKVAPVVKEEWYTSEDEDESDDDNITNLLKKIQQVPPKPQQMNPSGKVDLLAMLHTVQQKTTDTSKGLSSTQQHSSFWKNILGNVPPKTVPLSTNQPTATNLAAIPFEPKQRALLPDPIAKPEPTVPTINDPRLKNRDPRKLPREPSTTINIPKPGIIDIKNDLNMNNSPTHDLPLSKSSAVEPSIDSIPYRLRGISPTPLNYMPYIHASQSNPTLLKDPRLRRHMNTNTTLNNDPIIGNGKDHDIVEPTLPPPPKDIPPIPELLLKYEKPVAGINIFESSSSKPPEDKVKDTKPSIVAPVPAPCDPRSKRRDSRNNSAGSDTPPHLTIIDTILSPPHQEFKSAPVLESALVEPSIPKKSSPPVLEKSWTPPILEKNWEVAVKKEIEDSSDSNSNSNPEPPVLEVGKFLKKLISPPIKEEFMAIVKTEIPLDASGEAKQIVPPLIIKKVKHILPASHLPRAISDPRMATLHNPRRPQRLAASNAKLKSIVERKKQSVKTNNDEPKSPEIPDSIPSNEEKTKPVKDEKPKAKSIPKKRRLSDKSEEKKKTVHRNRKSSMDYASPLNSCDSTNAGKSLDYNSYNQRPKRAAAASVKNSPSTVTLSSSDSSSIPEFALSDNSNLECDSNSNDVNLKDRFKTIDPTASPFC